METETKREREKRIVSLMIAIYCRAKHGRRGLCPDCAALDAYARLRSDRCPFMETKTFCSNCCVHCYRPDMRERIRAVMRFSIPRMLFYHPILGCIGAGLGGVGAVVTGVWVFHIVYFIWGVKTIPAAVSA